MPYTLENFANNATTTLFSSCNDSTGTIQVVGSTAFPAAPYRIIVGTEIMRVTASTGGFLTVSRGQEGTTAAAHSAGDVVAHVITSGALLSVHEQPGQATCRVSLSSTDAAPESVQGGTLYLQPYRGGRLSLRDSNGYWRTHQVAASPVSVAVPSTTGMYDVFVRLVSNALAMELVPWANTTTRAIGLTSVDGVLAHSSDTTRRYVASFYVPTANLCHDTPQRRLLFNVTKARRPFSKAADWTTRGVTAAAYASAGGTGNRVDFVCGFDQGAEIDVVAQVTISCQAAFVSDGQFYNLGLGLDRSNGNDAAIAGSAAPYGGGASQAVARHYFRPYLGYHYLQLVEAVRVPLTVHGVDASSGAAGGIFGFIDG